MKYQELEHLREQLDIINSELLSVLIKRFNTLDQIRDLKQKYDLKKHDPERENAMLESLLRENKKQIPEEALTSIFKSIFATSRNYL